MTFQTLLITALVLKFSLSKFAIPQNLGSSPTGFYSQIQQLLVTYLLLCNLVVYIRTNTRSLKSFSNYPSFYGYFRPLIWVKKVKHVIFKVFRKKMPYVSSNLMKTPLNEKLKCQQEVSKSCYHLIIMLSVNVYTIAKDFKIENVLS